MGPRACPLVLLLAGVLSCKAQSTATPTPMRTGDAPSTGHMIDAPAEPLDEELPRLEHVCSGDQLDLRWMAQDSSRCTSPTGDGEPWPDAIVTRLAPSAQTLAAGATGYVDYVLTNRSNEEISLELTALACFSDLAVDVLDSDGKPVHGDCIGGGGCGAPSTRITIAAGADARYRLPVRAVRVEQGWVDDECVLDETPLTPGEYTLQPTMTFIDAPDNPSARLTVTSTSDADRALCDSADACIEAGVRSQTGLGADQDDDRARRSYGRACDLGEGLGCSMLADLQAGEDAEHSYARAATAFGFACDVGRPGDCYQLGFLLEEGKGVPRNHAAAERAHRQAYEGYSARCDDGDLDECDMAGKVASDRILRDEALAKAAYERTLATRETLCDRGDLETCRDLGIQFRDGKGVERDSERALGLLLKACEGGLADDCNLAASLLVTRDLDRAVELYARACKAGNPFACDFETMYCGRSSRPCLDQ